MLVTPIRINTIRINRLMVSTDPRCLFVSLTFFIPYFPPDPRIGLARLKCSIAQRYAVRKGSPYPPVALRRRGAGHIVLDGAQGKVDTDTDDLGHIDSGRCIDIFIGGPVAIDMTKV